MFSERHRRNQITMSLLTFTHVHSYLQFNGHRTISIIGQVGHSKVAIETEHQPIYCSVAETYMAASILM
jgi:hypothetical protein